MEKEAIDFWETTDYNVVATRHWKTAHGRATTIGGTTFNRGGHILTSSFGPGGPIIMGDRFFHDSSSRF